MVDVKQQRIFSVEQVQVPPSLPEILKNYSKEVIMNNPADIIAFSRKYFEMKFLEHGGEIKKDKKDKKDKKEKKEKKEKKKKSKSRSSSASSS